MFMLLAIWESALEPGDAEILSTGENWAKWLTTSQATVTKQLLQSRMEMPSKRASSLGHRSYLFCRDAQEQVSGGWVWLPHMAEQTARTVARSMGLENHIVSIQPPSILAILSACSSLLTIPHYNLTGLSSSPLKRAGR